MRNTKKGLVVRNIIKRFMTKKFMEIPKHKLVDIVPLIVTTRPGEMAILESWEEHFRSVKEPYAITEREIDHHTYGIVKVRTLWKEDYWG